MSLGTLVVSDYPYSFAVADNGYIYMANGIQPMPKWNGISSALLGVGVEPPASALTLASSGSGSLNGTYFAWVRFLNADGYYSNLSPISNSHTVVSKSQIDYTSVPTWTDSRVVERQILRNLSGVLDIAYVDVTDTTNSGSTFASTKDDNTLGTGTPVPLIDSDGATLVNQYQIPRNDKPLLVFHRSRLFGAGTTAYRRGHCEVTNGSPTVQGIGTEFRGGLINRFFHVFGHDPNYTISNVSIANQTLTLSGNYAGTTNKFAIYTIESPPAEKGLLYFSQSGLPEAWPAGNAVPIGSVGEETTGIFEQATFLYVLKDSAIYRVTYAVTPKDGASFLAARRGVINNRCWVHEAAHTYLLDQQGIYRFDGSEDVEDITPPLQDLFWRGRDGETFRIEWSAARFFHAAIDPSEKVIRWFVSLGGNYLPNGAIALDYRRGEWWTETYPLPIGASTLMPGLRQTPVAGGPAKKVFAIGYEQLDVARADAGQTYGTVTSAGDSTLSDSTASFPASHVGATVTIIDGNGFGQRRKITAVSGDTLSLLSPWTITPDETSIYQIGAVAWRWRSKRFRCLREEQSHDRGVQINWDPVEHFALLYLRIYRDAEQTPIVPWLSSVRAGQEAQPIRHRRGVPGARIDLNYRGGYAQAHLTEGGDLHRDQLDAISIELAGYSGVDALHIHDVTVTGVMPEGEDRRGPQQPG